MPTIIVYKKDELTHHGILGQKWGKKQGPPYPLNPSDHSASEKKAGWKKSLGGGRNESEYGNAASRKKSTESDHVRKKKSPHLSDHELNAFRRKKEEKARAKQQRQNAKELARIQKQEAKGRYKKQALEESVKKDIETYGNDRIKNIKETGSKIQNMANELGKDYDKAYKNASLSKSAKDEIWKGLQEDFGVGADDPDFFDMAVQEHVEKAIDKNLPKELKQKRSEFNSLQDQYWKNAREIVDDVVDKYKDTKVTDDSVWSSGEHHARKVLSDTLDTSVMSYISRHFDDYWVLDVDSRYDAIERLSKDFTMDAYNKRQRSLK